MADTPETEELVLATVKKIMPYGAFCTLDEYGGRECFLHISEVAPRWIKNIHEFLKEGQHLVAKVHNIIPEKNQIDISLKRVVEKEKKRKLESVKKVRRASKLFEVATKGAKSTTNEAFEARRQLEDKYGDLISAFEEISANGAQALKGLRIEKGLASELVKVAAKSVKKARAEVRAMLEITSYAEDGIERIKSLFKEIKKPQEAEKFQIHYLGAPKYQIVLVTQGKDYKAANKLLESVHEKIESQAKQLGLVSNWKVEGED